MEQERLLAQELEEVGRLSPGIAHQISTHLGCISDSVHFTRTSVDDLTTLLQTYRDATRIDGVIPEALATGARRARHRTHRGRRAPRGEADGRE